MKRGMLPLNALRAFESTVRLGRMSDAAHELGVTHGAISRQIRSLEERLGLQLFKGPRNRPELSDEARSLAPCLTEAFDSIETAVSRLTSERRPLDISCPGTLAMRWLIPKLYAFQDRCPKIDVRLTSDREPAGYRGAKNDVFIFVAPQEQQDNGVTTLLFNDLVGPVLSPALKSAGCFKSVSDLKGLPKLHTKTRRDAWKEWCRSAGASMKVEGKTFEHFYFMLEAATAGLGVGIAPYVLVRDDINAGRLIAPFGFKPNDSAYFASEPRRPNADTKAFISWLVEQSRDLRLSG